MPTYIALLRGINVSGQKLVKMESLRKLFESLKFKETQTYIQSGNVIFKSSEKSAVIVSKKIENRIERDFGFSVAVIVRNSKELEKIIQNNPFLKEKKTDLARLYVTFLSQIPEKSVYKNLDDLPSNQDEIRYSGQEVFLHCPSGYGKTKLSNNAIEKALSITATTRNWNTVNQLYQLCLVP